MEIRKSTPADSTAILGIFEAAKTFMHTHGNTTQWVNGYPGADVLAADIQRGSSYVFVENGRIVGTFALIFGADPNYAVLENGVWHADKPYAAIHRIASDGTVRGLAKACFAYCLTQTDYLRIDTHRDNLPMQAAVTNFGFRKCGTVYMRDGSPRIAFDYLKADEPAEKPS